MLASAALEPPPGAWERLGFRLVPAGNTSCGLAGLDGRRPRAGYCGYFGRPIPEVGVSPEGAPGRSFRTCWQCSGGLVLEASGAPVLVDFVELQPGPWGRWRGLPLRRDVAELMFDMAGWQVLRLGGSMCNVAEYRWKRFRGSPRGARPQYAGFWHPHASAGFGIFEVLEQKRKTQ